jgi:hypothetical protein
MLMANEPVPGTLAKFGSAQAFRGTYSKPDMNSRSLGTRTSR